MYKIFYPEETFRLNEDLYVVKSRFSNVFVFAGKDNAFCIDAGYGPDTLREGFDHFGIDADSVGAVFLTHTDFDHRGGLSLFPRARIYLGKDEEQMINGTTPRFFRLIHNRPIGRPYTLIENDNVIQLGEHTVRAISTPGHTPGHTAWLVDGTYLFTGDAVGFKNGSICPLIKIANLNHPRALRSYEMIKGMMTEVKYICTTHFGVHEVSQ